MNKNLPYQSLVEACFKRHLKAGGIVSVIVAHGDHCQEMTFPITTLVPEIKRAISGKFVEWLGEEKKSANRKLPYVNRPPRTVRVILATA